MNATGSKVGSGDAARAAVSAAMVAASGQGAACAEELAQLMESRAATYRLLARLFLKPLDEDDIALLVQADFVGQARAMGPDNPLHAGFNEMGRGLRRRHTGTKSVLASDYSMCFDGLATASGKVAVPYASVFLSEKGLLYGPQRAEVLAAFRAKGVGLKDGLDIPEDHLAFELEFLGYLAERTAEALRNGDGERAHALVDDSRAFLQRQVLSWTGALFEVARQLLTTRFYRGAVDTAEAFLELDRAVLDDVADELSDPAPERAVRAS